MMILCVSYGQVYKWTDSQGVIHFSDKPHEGSETVKLPEAQTYSAPVIKNDPDTEENKKNLSGNADHVYTQVAVTQPLNESTIRNNDGYVMVVAQLDPKLFSGDTVQVIFDGSPMGEPQPTPVFQLNGVYRGTHTIAVQVLDSGGNVVATSDPITVHVYRPQVNMGNRPML